MALISLILLAAVVTVAIMLKRIEDHKRNKLPNGVQKLPGPKGLPIIGSVHELPEKNSWMKFHEWGEKYGPIYQVNLAGKNHVVISRDSVAHDLLSKRSANYSNRPFIPALQQDNRTSGQYLPLMSKNELWTRQRRFAKQIMDTSEKESFYNYPELESVRLLFEMMTDPSRYNHALESFVARVTSRLAWGTSTAADELKQRARELLIGVSPSGAIGNKLPFIMSLPEMLSPAKAWELRRSRTERKFFETMQHDVAANMKTEAKIASGLTPMRPGLRQKQSWTSIFLEKKASWGFKNDLEGAYAVGMHGIAGALTIAAPMQSFCLAMCHHPQYQHLLYEEIDRVCGDRMPRRSDMPNMPVLRAFIRETMRWRPPVPTGIPHESVKDDIYEGHFIPAGSIIHPMEWSISRDPEVFLEPDAWNPTRWLDSKYPTYQEPLSKFPTITGYSQFGYGKRTCQGMGVAEADLFVGIGSMVWLFSMNANGEEEEEEEDEGVPKIVEPKCLRTEIPKQSTITGFWSGLQTPPDEEETSMNLSEQDMKHVGERLRMHRQDSAISMPGDFPIPADIETPPASPQRLSRACSTSSLQSDPFLPRSRIATPPKPSLRTSSNKPKPESDPTMNFSTLLIAKPKPFKLNLRIRNQGRADEVARKWMNLRMDGEFEESRVFWKGGNQGDAEHGWGKVFA